MDLWILTIFILAVIEIKPGSSQPEHSVIRRGSNGNLDFPLTKSFGYSEKNLNLADAKMSSIYRDLYQEMLKVNPDSSEMLSKAEESNLEDIMGKDRLAFMKRDVLQRRRKHATSSSSLGRRKARSQAFRLDRLNLQSHQSHMDHVAYLQNKPERKPGWSSEEADTRLV